VSRDRRSPIRNSKSCNPQFGTRLLQRACKGAPLDFCFAVRFSHLLAGLVVCLVAVSDSDAKLAILTAFAPINSLTSNVAGHTADVSVLVPPNAGPHDYSFSPGDMQKIARADVVIMNGAGLENWLQKNWERVQGAGRAA
jgi:ABC-type Zn uptake system ZnuABC Zn-binding protein ZnuA